MITPRNICLNAYYFYAPPELWPGFPLLKYNYGTTFNLKFWISLMPNLIIGSRGSKLALWQSNWVKDRLEEVYQGLTVSIEIVKTTGDKLTEALLDHRVDLAVHSLKDLPTVLPEGLCIAAITAREDVRDALIVSEDLRKYIINSIEDLPRCARIGTSSLRRASQLRHARPDLQIIELRGNVDTRLRKLYEGDYDAIILASAGL